MQEFFKDGCPQRAAAISYFSLLALFPLAILTVVVFGIVVSRDSARNSVIDFLLDNLPLQRGAGRADLRDLLVGVTQNIAAVGAIGVAGLLVSISGLMGAIRHALNAAFDRRERSRPPIAGKAFDVLLVFAAGAFVGASLGLTIALRFAARVSDDAEGLGAQLARAVLNLGELLPVALATAVFLFLYRVVPTGGTRLRDIWPGALVAALGYELAKGGFSVYLENFSNYSAVYGSLYAVVAFLVFIFVAANVFLLGAEVASEWPAVRDADPDDLRGGPGRSWRARVRGLFVHHPRE